MLAVNRFQRHLAAWLALLAIAFNAMWPTIASAQPPKPGVPMVICTPTGFKTVTPSGDPQQAPEHGNKIHCALCAPAGDQPLPVGAVVTPCLGPIPTLVQPTAASAVVPPEPARLSPPAQAPPNHS